jgi:diguanylate cyclase (GGDEF)-like protein
VHREPGNTAHYDLTAPVLDEAENPVGMLFVSFGLDSLKPLLRDGLSSDQHVELKDGEGKTISQWGVPQQDDNTRRQQLPVGGSDWSVTLTEPNGGSPLSFISLAIFNVSAFLLTVGVIAFLMRYAMRSFGADFAQVKTLLNSLAQGENLAEELPTPQLRETAEMFPAITHIRRDIDKKQQLLQHSQLNDDLTGLPNRRQFNNEFARAYDFARRGTLVCVTLLHIDGLDKLGDNQREQVLKILGKTLKAHSRKVDHSARLDDERFAMLLFGMKAEGATPFLERMLRNFQERQAEHPALPDDQLCSLQCGYTLIHPHRDGNAAEVLKRAETALQAAQSEADRSIIAA